MGELKNKKVTPLSSIGVTGLKIENGRIDEEFLRKLSGEKALELYTEMRKNSPIIAAALRVITMLIKQVEWRFEPADESDEAKAEAEETADAFEDMSHTLEDFIGEILSMLWAGFAPFEVVYKLRKGLDQEDGSLKSKYNDGKFGWRRIEIRAQDTISKWGFDEDQGISGFYQSDGDFYQEEKFIPVKKALLFRVNKEKNNPEGESLLRAAVVPYHFIKRIQEYEAIGIERNLNGMPVMQVPAEILSPNASPAERATRDELEDFVKSVRNDERYGALIPAETKEDGSPSGYKFKFETPTGGTKVTDTDTVIKRYRAEIMMMFMTQFLVMGTEKVGSYSLASSMTGLLSTSIGSILKEIKAVINQFLIPRRQELNGVSPDLNPTIEHGDIESRDLDEVAKYLQALMATGAVSPSEALERHLLTIGDLPLPPELDTSFDMLDDEEVDKITNSISMEQVKIVLEINNSLNKGVIDRESAINTIASALGVTSEKAETYLPGAEVVTVTDKPKMVSVAPRENNTDIKDEDEDLS